MNNSLGARLLLFALPILVLASGCAASRKASTAANSGNLMNAETLLQRIVTSQVKADWLDARANLTYQDGQQSVTATATIKMRRDSVLWMNVKKFGFELGRVLVTRDSVFVLDRINNEYYAEPLGYVQTRFKLPARLDFLEQLILGNPVFLVRDSLQASRKGDNQLQLSAARGGKSNTFLVGERDFNLQRMEWVERDEGRRLDLELTQYADIGQQNFAYLRRIELASAETGAARIEIEFTKVDLDVPTEIRFEIPSRYTRSGK